VIKAEEKMQDNLRKA